MTKTTDSGTLGSGLRLLHVTEAPEGGVLTYLANLIRIQASTPSIASIDVLGPSVNEAVLRESVGSVRVGSVRVGIHSVPYKTRSIGVLLRLAIATLRLIVRNRPDIVHIHSSLAGFVVRLCLLPAWIIPGRPRLIYMPHGWSFKSSGRPRIIYMPHAWSFSPGAGRFLALRCMCERWLSHWTDRIICVSEDERRWALKAGISAQRCTVVLSGIPSAPAPGPRHWQRKRRVLFVGRFDHQKGFDTYLEVLRLLDGQAEGLVAGAPSVGKHSDFVVPNNVTLLGWCSRERVAKLYQEVDILLMPSRFEGLPMVALEAMRAGLPIFALATGPLPEVLEDSVSGRLFQNPRQIADAIAAVRDEELQAFGEAGRCRFLEKFTSDRMAQEMLERYLEVLSPPHQILQAKAKLRELNPSATNARD